MKGFIRIGSALIAVDTIAYVMETSDSMTIKLRDGGYVPAVHEPIEQVEKKIEEATA